MHLLAHAKIIFSQVEACMAKGELDSAFPQFHISLNGGSPFFLTRVVVKGCPSCQLPFRRFIPVSPTFRNSYSCYSHYVKFRTTYLYHVYSIVCFRTFLLLHSKSINFGISLIA